MATATLQRKRSRANGGEIGSNSSKARFRSLGASASATMPRAAACSRSEPSLAASEPEFARRLARFVEQFSARIHLPQTDREAAGLGQASRPPRLIDCLGRHDQFLDATDGFCGIGGRIATGEPDQRSEPVRPALGDQAEGFVEVFFGDLLGHGGADQRHPFIAFFLAPPAQRRANSGSMRPIARVTQ